MATEYYYLTGRVNWAKVRKPDPDYDNYTIDFYPDAKSLEVIKETGIQVEPRQSQDEGIFYKFRRPHEKLIKKELVEFGPPQVLDKDNTEFDGLIGNGSEVTVKISVYDSKKGKAHRLEAVRVEKLVEYTPENTEGNTPAPKGFIPPYMSEGKSTEAPKATKKGPF